MQLSKVLPQARNTMIAGQTADDENVRFWVGYLEKAARNETDPFHAIAICDGKENKALKDYLARSLNKSREQKVVSAVLDVIVDYGHLKAEQWLPDDASYGPRPARPGDIQFTNDPTMPIARFHEMAAADIAPIWRGLKSAPGAQLDAGPLGAPARAGKTLHTPGFTIHDGQVHFLVRGAGRAYAAVDSHTLISGPLHGELVRHFNTGGKFQWVSLNLTNYSGHHAHLEFSPDDDKEFSVSLVVQGEKLDTAEPMVTAIGQRLSSIDSLDLASVADAYQLAFTDVVKRLENDTLRNSGFDSARLANWMLTNAGLLNVKDWDKVSKASATYMEEQKILTGQIRKESRLALAMQDNTAADEHVFIRGSHKALGDLAPRRFLEALIGTKGIEGAGSGRLELATQMVDPRQNPFITRVMVNRVWHHLFGRGIVSSTDNFGVLGEKPTHPELLDYLANRFAQEGWSLKTLIRQLVLTQAYQMSSQPVAAADEADPDNLLLHRMRLRRLEGEAVRDAMLQISGKLDEALYGPSVPVHLTPFLDGRGKPASGPIDGNGRRSLYIAARRNFLSPLLLAFDTPTPFSTVGRRSISNVPAQALILMNDPFVHQMATAWGKKIAAAPGTTAVKIASMYVDGFSRQPTDKEMEDCITFLEECQRATERTLDDGRLWAEFAHVLFNVKEFVFVE